MSKLSIFRIEDAGLSDVKALRVELFEGTDPDDAVISFNTVVFENNQNMLYRKLSKVLGDDDVWEADADLTDCVVVTGEAQKVKIREPFYRFEKNKKGQFVKASPERIVKFAKLVAFKGDSLENQLDRYLSNVPKECKIPIEEDEES